MKVGDLVRYRQGSLDRRGIILRKCEDGDFLVAFTTDNHKKSKCRWRCLEVINESR